MKKQPIDSSDEVYIREILSNTSEKPDLSTSKPETGSSRDKRSFPGAALTSLTK